MKETVEQLTEQFEKAEKEYKKVFDSLPNNLERYEVTDILEPSIEKMKELSRKIRMIKPCHFENIPTYGDIMELSDFIEDCKRGNFIDYDGHGYYAVDNKRMTDIMIISSDIKKGAIRKGFKKIVWFNR